MFLQMSFWLPKGVFSCCLETKLGNRRLFSGKQLVSQPLNKTKHTNTMKSFKLAIITAILAIGIAAPVASAADGDASARKGRQGQGQGQRGGGPTITAAWLKDITLTADQQKKVDAINAEVRKQREGLSPEDMRTKGREITQAAQKKVRDLLTDEQKATFDKNVAAARSAGKDKDKGKADAKKGEGKGKGGGKKKGGGGDE